MQQSSPACLAETQFGQKEESHMPGQSSVTPNSTPAPVNPFYPFALTRDGVEQDEGFLVYNIQDGLQPRDEFLTKPFVSLSGWLAVNTRNYPTTAKSLADFGIIPFEADGRWNHHNIAVANTPEGRGQLKEWLERQNSWMAQEAIGELNDTYPND